MEHSQDVLKHVQVNQAIPRAQDKLAVQRAIVITRGVSAVHIQDAEEQLALLNVINADVEAYATIQDVVALGGLALLAVVGVTRHADVLLFTASPSIPCSFS